MVAEQLNPERSPAGAESSLAGTEACPQGGNNKPVSERKLAANRRNAQLSTGPTSPDGKARSSQNSFKHGLYAQELIVPGENPAELDEVRASLRAEHQPVSETEEILVNEMAENFWRIRRMRRYEALTLQPENFDDCMDRLPIITRIMTSAERAFHRALRTLRQLQKERGFVPQKIAAAASASTQIGFVSQNSDEPEPAAVSNGGFVPQNPAISPGPDCALDEIPHPAPDISDEEASPRPAGQASPLDYLQPVQVL